MPKLAIVKKVGIPIPAVIPSDVTHFVVYWNPSGEAPAYDQTTRAVFPINGAPEITKDGKRYWVFDPAQIPASTVTSWDISSTLTDLTDKEEGDFAPATAVPLDRDPPPTLEAAVLLDD